MVTIYCLPTLKRNNILKAAYSQEEQRLLYTMRGTFFLIRLGMSSSTIREY